jgi:hypothetical protein
MEAEGKGGSGLGQVDSGDFEKVVDLGGSSVLPGFDRQTIRTLFTLSLPVILLLNGEEQ